MHIDTMVFKIGNKVRLGMKHLDNTRIKMSESAKGRKAWNKGLKLNYKTNGFFKDGHPPWNKGKLLSTEHKDKIRIARMKQKLPTRDTSIELKVKEILDRLRIPYKTHKSIMGITQPDFFIEPNICVYCDGDYWHSRPEVVARDTKQNEILTYAGYKIIRLTETKINNNVLTCEEELKSQIH